MPSPPASGHDTAGFRRFLIAAGTARYDRLGDDAGLPSVVTDLAQVRQLFEQRLHYECVLPDLASDPTSGQFRSELSGWLTDDDRRPGDLVVVYYSGHGAYGPDGRHYLLTRDSSERNMVGTALPTEDLVRMLGATAIQHALVIIDTCYAGAGTYDLLAVLRSVSSSRYVQGSAGSGLWFVAAARPKEEAQQGAFVPCLVEAVENPRHGMAYQRFLDPNSVIADVNEQLQRSWPHQHARAAMGDSSGTSPLLPNPRYRPDLPSGLDVETQRSLLDQGDVLSHWGPRSRGVEVEGDKGWYFTGRRVALRELVSWLAEGGDGRIKVVTGGPGSGKSALLARLVTLSDPGYRSRVPREQLGDPDTTPPPESIDVAVIARDRTLADVIGVLAETLGIDFAEPATFLASLASVQRTRLTIVLDSLDEAIAPRDIARRLLAPLSAARIPGLNVLVGTRREVLPSLGTRTDVMDLDDPRYLSTADLAEYSAKILGGGTGITGHSPYRDKPRLARQVAEAVAARAYPSFLIARIVSRSLVDARDAVDIGRRGWRTRFPATVGDALDEYLERFGADEQRVRDLLQPLAYAAGSGLPWENIWAPLASALSGVGYTDSDVRWLLDRAGAYIVESTADERSVYRLYHAALAEHLRDQSRGVDADRRITATLMGGVPRANGAQGPNWRRANPYVRSYLAVHAARSGLLDGLLTDPLFLVVASPRRLTEVLPAAGEDDALSAAHVYRRAAHRLRGGAYADNAAVLELTARCTGHENLARRLARLPLGQSWHVPWARWQPAQDYGLVGRHDGAVTAMALTVFESRVVVITGGEDATVRCWDLVDGVPAGESLPGDTAPVRAVVAGTADGRALIVSADKDGGLQRWDLADVIPVGEPMRGHEGRVNALTVGEVPRQVLVVSAGDDGSIRRWDLGDGSPVGPPMWGHEGRVTALTVADVPGRTLVVSAGDDGTVRRWDLADGSPVGPPARGQEGRVNALAVGVADGGETVVSGAVDWSWRMWDPRDGRQVGRPVTVHDAEVTSVALGEVDGHALVVSGSADTYVRCWDVVEGRTVGDPLMSHDGTVTAVRTATVDGELAIVSASADGTIRRWRTAPPTTADTAAPAHAGGVSAVAAGRVGAETWALSGGADHVLRRWNLRTGEPVGNAVPGHGDWVNAMVTGTLAGRPVVASAGGDGTVRLWDLESGSAVGSTLTKPGWVNAVALGTIDGSPVAAAGGNDGLIHRWNLQTWEEVGDPICSGQRSVLALLATHLGGIDVLVSAGADGTLRPWRAADGEPLRAPVAAHDAEVWCLAATEGDGVPIALTGDANGAVRWWDLAEWQPLGAPVTGHGSAVFGVAMGRLDGHDLGLSIGGDGSLCLWRPPGTLVQEIATGGGLLDVTFVPPCQALVTGWRGMLLLELSACGGST
ncbi:caspase family protein [Geodermatophilus sp. URMC 63]